MEKKKQKKKTVLLRIEMNSRVSVVAVFSAKSVAFCHVCDRRDSTARCDDDDDDDYPRTCVGVKTSGAAEKRARVYIIVFIARPAWLSCCLRALQLVDGTTIITIII